MQNPNLLSVKPSMVRQAYHERLNLTALTFNLRILSWRKDNPPRIGSAFALLAIPIFLSSRSVVFFLRLFMVSAFTLLHH